MKKSILTFASFAVRIAGAASLAILASYTVGCMAEAEPEDVGEAAQKTSTVWNQIYLYSSTNLSGSPLPSGTPNCFLAGLRGSFNMGQSPQWDVKSLFSEAGIDGSTLNFHGGAYTDINNQRVWANNSVGAMATCLDNQVTVSGGAQWGGIGGSYDPQFIAAAHFSNGYENRQCFIKRLEAADNSFGDSSDFVRVKKYTTTDSLHTTPGWYIEGHLGGSIGYDGPPSATAVCYDFPTPNEIFPFSITSSSGNYATVTTSGTLGSACGLTTVGGPFTNNSQSTGVWTGYDSSSGHWLLHAYGGQFGTAVCVDW